MKECETVQLTREHLIEWFGEDGRAKTVKGKAMLVDGKLVGVGGLAYVAGHWFAFTDLKPEAKKYRLTLHKTVKRYLEDQRSRHKRIFAGQDGKEPTAERWLARLGFEKMNEVWLWRA